MRRTSRLPAAGLLALALSLGALAGPAGASYGVRTTPGTLTGVVREIVVEHPGEPGAGDDGRKTLVVGTRPVALPAAGSEELDPGERVEVRLGTGSDGRPAVVAARSLAPAAASARTAPSASDPALHEVHVAIVAPQGWSRPHTETPARVGALVQQASDYWSSQTGGRVRFDVAQTVDPYTSAFSCSDPDVNLKLWEEALGRAGAAAWGIDRHLLVVLPEGADTGSCAYGLGTVGSVHTDGNAALVSSSNPSLYAHELGHNLGLHHSGALRCPTTADAAPSRVGGNGTSWASPCWSDEYDDVLDVMGYSGRGYGEGNLNGVHLDRTGLTPSAVQPVPAYGPTTVRLAPLSAPVGEVRTAVVTDAGGGRYYAEYRTASGRDEVALGHPAQPSLGLRVLREDPSHRNGSYLLDATPTGRADDHATSLATGRSFTTASGTVRIRLLRADATGADLEITRTREPASATLAVPAKAAAGSPVTARARVLDAVDGGVAAWPVVLQVQPRGSSTWRTVTTATTDATGTAAFRYTNGITGTYRAVTQARGGVAARTSATDATTSSAAPVMDPPRREVTLGTVVRPTGTLVGVPSPVVRLQARRGADPWTTRATAVRDGSRWQASYRLPSRGTWQLRLSTPADSAGRYTAGLSAAYTVRVR